MWHCSTLAEQKKKKKNVENPNFLSDRNLRTYKQSHAAEVEPGGELVASSLRIATSLD